MPVTEVCAAVGFQSLGSFSACSASLTGESPGAYRAARRKSAPIPACFVRMYRAEPASRNFGEAWRRKRRIAAIPGGNQ